MQLNTCVNIREVGELLRGMEDLRFFWVNLSIGITLSYGEEAPGAWGAAEVWDNALNPWETWGVEMGEITSGLIPDVTAASRHLQGKYRAALPGRSATPL